MNLLRWILLAGGLLLLVGIYWWGRRSKASVSDRPPAKLQTRGDSTPTLSDEVPMRKSVGEPTIRALDDDLDSSGLPSMTAHGTPEAPEPFAADNRVELFDVDPEPAPPQSSRGAEAKPGAARTAAASGAAPLKRASTQRKIVALRLSAGPARIDGGKLKALFDSLGLTFGRYNIYHRMHDPHTPLYSVASMVEPGTFDPQAMTGAQFPGITLFMQLPGPIDGQEILAQMVACARQLEQNVGGQLQDERGLELTEPRVQRLRDDVTNFLHLLGQNS